MELTEKMKNELLERFAEKNLSITGIIVKGKSKSLDVLPEGYKDFGQWYANSGMYYRNLKN